MKGTERNKPCPCGSGVKAKLCRALHPADLAAAYEEHEHREYLRTFDRIRSRRRAREIMTVAAVLGAL